MRLSLPDIEPYRTKKRKAEPTQGVLLRWARHYGVWVDTVDFMSDGKTLRVAALKRIYSELGIPWKEPPKKASRATDR